MDRGREEDPAEERSPLLRAQPRRSPSILLQNATWAVYLVAVVAFMIDVGAYLMEVPLVRIYEDIICHHYYDVRQGDGHISLSGTIDESLCKGDAVQMELAILMGGLDMANALPGVFLALPYGLLADRIGRKPVFGLGILGSVLSYMWIIVVCWFWQALPLRLIWLSPIFQLMGGGDRIIMSMLFATISDLSTDDKRATNFLFAMTGSYLAELIATPVSALLMQRTPWLPFTLGIGFVICGSLLIIFVPETLRRERNGREEPLIPDTDSESLESPDKIDTSSVPAAIKSFVVSKFESMTAGTSILRSVPVLLLLIPFLIDPFLRGTIDLSMRYISKRFSWPLSRTGFLLSLRAAINIALYLGVIPGLSYLLTRPKTPNRPTFLSRISLPTASKDLLLARGSILFLIAGCIIIGLSSTIGLTITGLAIFTLGSGSQALCRTVITSLIDKEHIGRLYAVIATTETFSYITGGPMLALLYTIALELKGAWFGLPFYFVAVCCSCAAIAVFSVRLPPAKEGSDPQSWEEAAAADHLVGGLEVV